VSNDTVTFSGGWTAAQLSGVVAGGVDRTVTAGGTNHNPPPFPDASFEAVVDGHLGGTTAAPTTSTSTTTTLPLGL
jgi:hypothetical protein